MDSEIGAANGDRTCNPLRLREELMRERMQPRPSIEAPSEAVTAAVERGGGSALLTETLLPRLAGEREGRTVTRKFLRTFSLSIF